MAFEMQVDIDPSLDIDIDTHPTVEVSVEQAANEIAAAARELASHHRLTGRYADGIVVQKSNRARSGSYRVFSSDPKSAWLEFGNGRDTPAFFVLRNAVEISGYGFSKKTK